MNKTIAKSSRKFTLLGIFAIAMGLLEAIVVVYIRLLYYPEGFDFPLVVLSPDIIIIEWVREIATIVMLISIGIIAAKERLQWFFYFLFTFAIWDIVYYAGLKIFLNWPASFLTWDILFLIPIPWIGPVLAPIICSLTMIVFSVSIISKQENGFHLSIKLSDWGILILGVLFILYSFMKDFFELIYQNQLLSEFSTIATNEHFWQLLSNFIPTDYNWYLFTIGEILILLTNVLVIKRMTKPGKVNTQ